MIIKKFKWKHDNKTNKKLKRLKYIATTINFVKISP